MRGDDRTMRGTGTLYRQPGSRFWWMQYFSHGQRFRESTGRERHKDAQTVLKDKLLAIGDGPSEIPQFDRRRALCGHRT